MFQRSLSHQSRPEQMAAAYSQAIDAHLNDLLSGKGERMFEIEDFADLLCVHPIHLSNTIKAQSGMSACGIYQLKIINVAHALLNDRSKPVKEVAAVLCFNASQFTKWFKKFHGITPKAYRAGKAYSLQY